DSALLQTGRFHQCVEGAALVAVSIEDGGGRFHSLPPGLFAFGHRLAPDRSSETDRSFLIINAPAPWMLIETFRSHARRNMRPIGPICFQLFRTTGGSGNCHGRKKSNR